MKTYAKLLNNYRYRLYSIKDAICPETYGAAWCEGYDEDGEPRKYTRKERFAAVLYALGLISFGTVGKMLGRC